MWVILIRKLLNLVCHCQSAYSATESCFELLAPQWLTMKHQSGTWLLAPFQAPTGNPIYPVPDCIQQDSDACLLRAGFIRDYIQNLGIERMAGSACSSDLNSWATWLCLNDVWECDHPTAVYDQANEHREEVAPGCCGFVRFLHLLQMLLLVNLIVYFPICLISSDVSHPIQ